jgi:two-component system sensor histidine kinase HydH
VSDHKKWIKILAIVVMIVAVIGLHYLTPPQMRYQHAIYRMLFYLPLVLGSFWFGLKGALYISGSVVSLYLLYLVGQWKVFSYEVFDKLLEMIVYLVIALVVGLLVEKERRKHRALLRAESLAAIGRTVSEVAHDMKTPLIAIGGLVAQVSRTLPEDNPDRKRMDLVIQEAARLESMAAEMLTFGRPLEIQLTETNLNELVQESVDITRGLAKKAGVELKADLDVSLPFLGLDAPRVKQVLLNLITNAIQASPSGERVLVKTRVRSNVVVLEVSDCGSGIREEDQEIVFSPFFSTKRGGTGLGLAIVKKIVEAHGGEVCFQSNPEMGVTFIVQLPIREN